MKNLRSHSWNIAAETGDVDAASLAAVERAMSELRRGGIVVLRDASGLAALVTAAEAVGRGALERLKGMAQAALVLITTRRRALAVGIDIPPHIAGGMGDRKHPLTLVLPGEVPPDVILQPHEEGATHAALRHLSRPI